jgi:hypothetical protein
MPVYAWELISGFSIISEKADTQYTKALVKAHGNEVFFC